MLGNVYYFFTLILIIFNILTLANIEKFWKISDWISSFKKVTNKNPEKEDFKAGELELHSFIVSNFVFNCFWIFLGILSKSYLIYLLLILVGSAIGILSSITNSIFNKNTIFSKVMSVLLLLFITIAFTILLMNHHHWHLELADILLKHF